MPKLPQILAVPEKAPLYGSSRLGSRKERVCMTCTTATLPAELQGVSYVIRGEKSYELSNHLGNVLAVVSDRREAGACTDSLVDFYYADGRSVSDYYPFGMGMDSRTQSGGGYRWGFNGQEKDDEVAGEGNAYDFGARVYDSRLGRWFSVDLMYSKFAGWSPYNYTLNNPLFFIDPDGNIPWPVYESWVNRNGKTVFRKLGSRYRTAERPRHNGVDINLGVGSDDLGAPVLATHSGKVVGVKPYTDNDGGGNRIYIQSVDGSIQTRYMHLESFADGLTVGSEIKEGQVIGYIGGSGKGAASGLVDVHLHYELLQRNGAGVMEHINPVGSDGNLLDPQKMLGLQSEDKMVIYAERLSFVNERISILSEKLNILEVNYKEGGISEDKYNSRKSRLEARKDLQIIRKENLERKLSVNE